MIFTEFNQSFQAASRRSRKREAGCFENSQAQTPALRGSRPERGQPCPREPKSRSCRTKVSALLLVAAINASLLILGPTSARAQGGMPLWTNVSSGVPYGLAVDSSGNVFVGGAGIIKYSGAGTPLWTNLAHNLQFIVVDKNGNAFATDYWYDSATFNNGALLAYSSAGVPLWTNRAPLDWNFGPIALDSSGNVFGTLIGGDHTIKYSNAGVPLWTNRNGFYAEALAVDSSGNVFVTGFVQTPTNFYDVTIKYSNAGVPLWTNRYNPGVPDQSRDFRDIALDSSGNVFLTGSLISNNPIGTAADDYLTVAYSNSGVPLWTNRYDGPANGGADASAIAVDASGNVFVTGHYLSGSATIKYSNSGVPLWTNYYDGPWAGRIAVDSGGNVFVTGSVLNAPCCPVSADVVTIAYSNAGELLWENRYNGPTDPTGIAVDRAGNVFVNASSGIFGHPSSYSTTIKYSSSLPPPVQLDFQTLNNQLVLSWTNAGFNLQSASAVTGPFTNIVAATSPYTNSLTGSQQFFRLNGF